MLVWTTSWCWCTCTWACVMLLWRALSVESSINFEGVGVYISRVNERHPLLLRLKTVEAVQKKAKGSARRQRRYPLETKQTKSESLLAKIGLLIYNRWLTDTSAATLASLWLGPHRRIWRRVHRGTVDAVIVDGIVSKDSGLCQSICLLQLESICLREFFHFEKSSFRP